MELIPFPSEDHLESQPRVYTVSELTGDVRAILESAFDSVWVEGEISNWRVAASKHAYFVLKDERTQIRCVFFRGHRAHMKFEPNDGDQVLLFGRMAVYEARGEYQVIVESMEPRGLGALQKAFEQLKEKLGKEGLFDEERKRPLPEVPWKIGVVTSPTGAVIRDIIHVARRRNPKISILLYPVKVQGEGAAAEIVRAIKAMNQRDDLDALIVGRGGGSIEDLWAFNEEIVARAIHESRLPVVSAVGHEIDFTIADFVADVRAPTPSAAAEILVPVYRDLQEGVRRLTDDLFTGVRRRIDGERERLRNLIDRRFFRQPRHLLETPAQRLDDLSQRLSRALTQGLTLHRTRLQGQARRLLTLSPHTRVQRLQEQRQSLMSRLQRSMDSGLALRRERVRSLLKNLNAYNPVARSTRRLQELSERLRRGLNQQVVLNRARLESQARRLHRASPQNRLIPLREKCQSLQHRLEQKISARIELKRAQFRGLVKNLNAYNPLEILERGYSICTSEESGQALKDSRDAQPGDRVDIRLARGRLGCKVEEVKPPAEKNFKS